MIDHDEVVAHEVRQQEAVNEGVQALYEATRDVDDYRDVFRRIGKAGLTALQTPSCLNTTVTALENEWNALASPLALCTKDEVERKYLLSLVLKRVIESALDEYYQAYRRVLIEA